MKVTVKFLGAAREKAGVREESLELGNDTTVLGTLQTLAARRRNLQDYLFDSSGNPRPHLRFLLNGRSISMKGGFSAQVTEDSTLMIFPPTSGG